MTVMVQESAKDAHPEPESISGGLPVATECVETIVAAAAGRKVAVFLDYDGTLAPIAGRPDQAVLSTPMRDAVAKLAKRVPVAVVSGRDREVVRRLVQVPAVRFAGSHGLDVEGEESPLSASVLVALDQAEAVLRKRLAGVRGALVERKRFAVAAHYRLVAPSDVQRVEAAAREALETVAGLRREEGHKVIELRPDVDGDKGTAVRRLLEQLGPQDSVFPIYVGDDVTDEDAFRAIQGQGVGIVVAKESRATAARYRLEGPTDVQRFLERILMELASKA